MVCDANPVSFARFQSHASRETAVFSTRRGALVTPHSRRRVSPLRVLHRRRLLTAPKETSNSTSWRWLWRSNRELRRRYGLRERAERLVAGEAIVNQAGSGGIGFLVGLEVMRAGERSARAWRCHSSADHF